ncbi:hypothetical protein HQO27_02185 [Rhodococcus fascians]|nr:hypothetical protein [Rhodococcus fascians]MBY4237906.1 hypothetical protein [Rhodococcus fascians]MBY4253343.1 hypothetical protein [Rhodococcus fascians]MBY4268980.1 hypothetical protein [Rhodococcus fascians]MBY4275033.1 hypothetical protein [Rhodococcus fascians]
MDVGRTRTDAVIPQIFRGLCDDAALFPPGNAPIDAAVPGHLAYRDSAFADLVGPFVFPIPRLAELKSIPAPLSLSLTAPGGPGTVEAGLAAARAIPGVTVVAVEVTMPTGTDISMLRTVDRDVDIYVEIPRDERRAAVFDAVDERGYRAKFRTGGVTADLYPEVAELAHAIGEATRREIPFKATAGLHHAIRNTDPARGFEQHGYLNVLLAAQAAHSGARKTELESILEIRDPGVIARLVGGIEAERVFLSFGTCSIHEPLADLMSLGLIPPT